MNNKIALGLATLLVAMSASGVLYAKPDEEKNKEKQRIERPSDDFYEERDKAVRKSKDKSEKEKDRRRADDDDRDDRSDEKNQGDEPRGLAKQRDKKAVQEQKELGKGSEQGQAAREENSRKWWKFWE